MKEDKLALAKYWLNIVTETKKLALSLREPFLCNCLIHVITYSSYRHPLVNHEKDYFGMKLEDICSYFRPFKPKKSHRCSSLFDVWFKAEDKDERIKILDNVISAIEADIAELSK